MKKLLIVFVLTMFLVSCDQSEVTSNGDSDKEEINELENELIELLSTYQDSISSKDLFVAQISYTEEENHSTRTASISTYGIVFTNSSPFLHCRSLYDITTNVNEINSCVTESYEGFYYRNNVMTKSGNSYSSKEPSSLLFDYYLNGSEVTKDRFIYTVTTKGGNVITNIDLLELILNFNEYLEEDKEAEYDLTDITIVTTFIFDDFGTLLEISYDLTDYFQEVYDVVGHKTGIIYSIDLEYHPLTTLDDFSYDYENYSD